MGALLPRMVVEGLFSRVVWTEGLKHEEAAMQRSGTGVF